MVGGVDLVAIVTGGSRGLGRDAAHDLARRGCAVVVGYAHDQRAAEAAVDAILAAGGSAVAVRADVADTLDVERLFAETIAAFGRVDVVIHAAPCPRAHVDAEAARHLRGGGTVVDARSRDQDPPGRDRGRVWRSSPAPRPRSAP
jgi:NAD(P)-dependent dehydrogenase (short-subunit alcohol dehydrogenase family)